MASYDIRHSTGGRFKKRGASDLGSGAIKTQADIVIDSLKLQQRRTSEYASDYKQGLKGVAQTEEWNQNLLNNLEDKIFQNKRSAIEKRQQTEVSALEDQAKEYGKKAEFWKDFSTTYSKQWGKLAGEAVDLQQRVAANQKYDDLKKDDAFNFFKDQDKLQKNILKILSGQFDENKDDPKALNTLTKLFNGQNQYFRAKVLKEIKVQIPAIKLSIEDTIKNNEEVDPETGEKRFKWTADTIEAHYTTFAKGLIQQYDLDNTKEGREVLQLFSKYGHLEAQFQRNVSDVESDKLEIIKARDSFDAVKTLSKDDPEYYTAQQNFYSAVASAKRKDGDKFSIGYDTPLEALYATAQVYAESESNKQDFVDTMMGFPTPGNKDVSFDQRNKEVPKNEFIRSELAKIHKEIWEQKVKDNKAAKTAEDAARVIDFQEELKTIDPTTIDGKKRLSELANENGDYPLVSDEISKAQLFNFNNKNAFLINDDILKAAKEGDLKRLNSIVPYLSADLKAKYQPLSEDLNLLITELDPKDLNTYAADQIKRIAQNEGLKAKSNTTGDAENAYKQVFYKAYSLTDKEAPISQRVRDAKEAADKQSELNAGLFRRGKDSTGNLAWMAFTDDDLTWENGTPSKSELGKGLTGEQLNHKLSENSVQNIIDDPDLGETYNILSLDEYDTVQKAIVRGDEIPIFPNLELLWRSQTGPNRLSREEILNSIMLKGTANVNVPQLPLQVVPGNLAKADWEVNKSNIFFKNFYNSSKLDQLSMGILANMSDDPTFKLPMSQSLENIFTKANESGLDPYTFINGDPKLLNYNYFGGKL